MAIQHPEGLGVAYVCEYGDKGKWQVVFYRGTAGRPSSNVLYSSREVAEKKVSEWFESLDAHKKLVSETRAAWSIPHTLKPGDIITNSWGYDQTNVDAYQVTRTSNHFVWLRPIECQHESGEGCSPMSGTVRPIKDAFVKDGEETQHKANSTKQFGNSVCFKYGSGSVWDGRPLYESWYA